jgi:hypothetical protein
MVFKPYKKEKIAEAIKRGHQLNWKNLIKMVLENFRWRVWCRKCFIVFLIQFTYIWLIGNQMILLVCSALVNCLRCEKCPGKATGSWAWNALKILFSHGGQENLIQTKLSMDQCLKGVVTCSCVSPVLLFL